MNIFMITILLSFVITKRVKTYMRKVCFSLVKLIIIQFLTYIFYLLNLDSVNKVDDNDIKLLYYINRNIFK